MDSRHSKLFHAFSAGAAACLFAVAILFFSHLLAARDSKGDLPYKFFPNDFGPPSVDVSHYPPEIKNDYRLFLRKCSVCHTVARPLNAQFLQLDKEQLEKLKRKHPNLAQTSPDVVMPDPKAWVRIIKRMAAKPGASISAEDGKKILEFLVYDSKVRKTGKNLGKWETRRRKLLARFKRLYPKMYNFLQEIGEL